MVGDEKQYIHKHVCIFKTEYIYIQCNNMLQKYKQKINERIVGGGFLR